MGERSFAEDVKQLGLGAGQTLRGEGILAITKALLQSGVSYVGGYPGAPISHLLDVLADANEPLLRPLGIYYEISGSEAAAAALLGASINYPMRGAVTWKSVVGTNVASDALSHVASAGVVGGALVVIGEDYGEGASILQERTHSAALKSSIPLIDPRNDLGHFARMVDEGFGLSEAASEPVFFSIRIRACHMRGTLRCRDNVPPAISMLSPLRRPSSLMEGSISFSSSRAVAWLKGSPSSVASASADSVARIDVRRERRMTLEGAGVGLLAGTLLALAASPDWVDENGDCTTPQCLAYRVLPDLDTRVAVLGVTGVLLGVIIGSETRTATWATVHLKRLNVGAAQDGGQDGGFDDAGRVETARGVHCAHDLPLAVVDADRLDSGAALQCGTDRDAEVLGEPRVLGRPAGVGRRCRGRARRSGVRGDRGETGRREEDGPGEQRGGQSPADTSWHSSYGSDGWCWRGKWFGDND